MQLKKHFKSIVLLTFLFFMAAPFLFQMEDSNAYSIRVNRNTNVVTVYNDSGGAVKAMTCSVGTGTKTPTGSFSILTKDSWHTLMGPVYAPYCSKVTSDGVWFHPVWYYQNGNRASQSVQSYNMLGTKASHGCIRLTLADAKWIYENCPVGTRVTIFDGSSASDPLGKPATYKLPGSYTPTASYELLCKVRDASEETSIAFTATVSSRASPSKTTRFNTKPHFVSRIW